MKWHRLIFALVLLGIAGACQNPAGPSFPKDEDKGSEPEDKNKQGFVITEPGGIWV